VSGRFEQLWCQIAHVVGVPRPRGVLGHVRRAPNGFDWKAEKRRNPIMGNNLDDAKIGS